jgi:hypothetical protein
MPRGKAKQDVETLEMALVGFEQKKLEIDEKIRQIKSLLGDGSSAGSVTSAKASAKAEAPARKKRTLSVSARKRIALAQKKRWAEHRKKQTEASK